MAILRLKDVTHIFIVFFICTLDKVSCGKKGITRITDENWQQVLEGEWLIEFYAPWCPACKSLAPTWDAVSDWSADLDIKVAAVDVTEEAGLSGRFMITSLPSIYQTENQSRVFYGDEYDSSVIDGQFRRYMGPRTENDIVTFIEDRKFQDVEVVSSWRAPDSLAMGIVSFIFKVSMKVRIFHTIMTEEYGFPWWSTYGFVAVATVFMGLTLGMILVFLTDCCCPQKPPKGYLDAPRGPEVNAAGGQNKIEEEEEDVKKAEGIENKVEEEVVEKAEGNDEPDESTVRQRKTGTNEEGDTEAK